MCVCVCTCMCVCTCVCVCVCVSGCVCVWFRASAATHRPELPRQPPARARIAHSRAIRRRARCTAAAVSTQLRREPLYAMRHSGPSVRYSKTRTRHAEAHLRHALERVAAHEVRRALAAVSVIGELPLLVRCSARGPIDRQLTALSPLRWSAHAARPAVQRCCSDWNSQLLAMRCRCGGRPASAQQL